MLFAIAAAGALLAGLAAATPALAQARPITLLCSPGSNGGTLVNGVCVLPAAAAGQPYEAFLLTSNGAVDTFTITIKVTDSAGDQATEPGSITISP
jgi:hypothetical protein